MTPGKRRSGQPLRLARIFSCAIAFSFFSIWILNGQAAVPMTDRVKLGINSYESLAQGLDKPIRRAENSRDNLEPIPRPPIDSIVQGWNITGDASWLLQFSVIGFPKCGTSTLMFHLRDHPEIQMFPDERCELSWNQHARLIEDLYTSFPASTSTQRFIRGIKCPLDLENTVLSLPNYKNFFPKTDFLVGIRHPVLWFESFYNFRIHNQFPLPEPEKLIGRCMKGAAGVCTFRSNFHVFLNNLGKTGNETVLPFVDSRYKKAINVVPTKRKVFLYEVSQLSDADEARSLRLRQDLQSFLHLENPIEPFIWFKPGKNHSDASIIQAVERQKIDICQHLKVKEELMRHAIQVSDWIIQFFIDAEGVVVSSKDHLREIMTSWKVDPCIERGQGH